MQHWHKIIDTLILNYKFKLSKIKVRQKSIILTGMEEEVKGRPSLLANTSSTGLVKKEGDEGRAGDVFSLLMLLEAQGSCNKE